VLFRSIYVAELREDSRWARYREHAVTSGVRSSLSLPLTVSEETIGALNMYCMQPEGFDNRLRQSLSVFAAQAVAALAMVLRQARQDQVATHLEQALASRTVIDQAMGIVMAEQRCTADEAFALLRAHSQNTNRKLRDVAAEVIARVSGASPKAARPSRPEYEVGHILAFGFGRQPDAFSCTAGGSSVPACRENPVSVGPGPDDQLVVELRKDASSSRSLVRLRGELDVATAPGLQRRLDSLIDRGVHHLVVDLADVSFCDLAGVRVLLGADRQLRTRGGHLTLLGPCSCVSRISSVFDLTSQLPIQSAADSDGDGQHGAGQDGAGSDGAGSEH